MGSTIKLSPDQLDEMHNQKVLFKDIDRAMNSSAFLKITPRVSIKYLIALIVCEFTRDIFEHPPRDHLFDDPQEGISLE